MSKMTAIYTPHTPPSFKRRISAAAIEALSPGGRTSRSDRRNPRRTSPPPGTPPQSLAIARGRAFPILALLAALITCLVLLPGGPVQAHDDPVLTNHDNADHIHYPENRTDPVRSFASTDPEGSRIEWNLRGVDAADFEMSSTGVLTFRESPDYENPTDRGLNLNPGANANQDNDFADDDEFTGDDRMYQITVSATEISNALPAKRTDMAITVIVGNADDAGELTLQWLQPEVGTPITATLTDQDGSITVTNWTWYRSKVAGLPDVTEPSHWIEVARDLVTVQPVEATSSYTPQGDTVDELNDVAIDEDDYLRVKVVYEDGHGASNTVNGISMHPVRAEVSPGANASPDFQDDTDTRTVAESTAVGDSVGDPVTATDTDNDIVTYELVADVSPNDGDVEFFDINMASGQITVAQELDYDSHQDRGAVDNRPDDGEYKVVVRATDPSGLDDNITVTITAENVNEDPVVTGRAELRVAEGTTNADGDLDYTSLPDAPGRDEGPEPTNQENEYVYEDPEYLDSIASWTLEGDDAGAFDHSGRFEPRYLQFKVAPDYENPDDMNRDNVYEVTLVATDTNPLGTGAGIGKVNVWLIVTNVDEAGKVVFTEGETAFLDEMLVAEVQDPDDHGGDLGKPHEGVHIVNWQWSRAPTDVADTEFEVIASETTNTYIARDMDRGYYLRATARYTDPLRSKDFPSNMEDPRIAGGSLRTEMATTENAVRVAPGVEDAPTFAEAEDGDVTRYVAEDAMASDNVGAPVVAMAAHPSSTLVHTLEGADAEHFDIGSTDGQITVGTGTSFDYEDPEKPNTYRVTVKVEVTGGDTNQKAEADVNIIVTDVNETPVITDEDVDVDAMTAIMYPEIDEDGEPNTAAVATYVGSDPEGASISWDLRGADASFFTIDGGVLQFVNSPDFEDPKDRSGANTATPDAEGIAPDGMGTSDNIYSVVVRAIASRALGDTGPAETVDTTVTVTVTDVDEDGDVVISLLQPEVGFVIMASLTDPDRGVSDTSWEWEVSEVVQGSLDVDNDDHWGDAPGVRNGSAYTPDGANLGDDQDTNDTPIDEGKYLRVTVSYTDENDSNKIASAMSANPVQARALGKKNQSPDFEGDKVELSVAETAEVGDDVPGPVVATVVAPSFTDILTYGLRAFDAVTDLGDTGVTVPVNADLDVAAFEIDKATGQITVAQKLDFESRGTPDDGKYVVVATVTDPSGLGDNIVVVITAEDINEDPVLSGRPELTINETDSGDEDADSPLFVGNTADADPTVNVYNVVDEDRRAATDEWRLEGDDKEQFQLIGNVGRTLVFKNQPDYENPADADGDNVYKITVVTFDGDGGRGEFDVCIAVMNINELGKITLLDEDGDELVQPRAQGPITAKLTDPDGDVTSVTWQWVKSQLNPPVSPDPRDIATAMSDTYTPTNDDTSYFLRVTAMYTDGAEEITAGSRTAVVTAAHAVLEVLDLEQPPAFPQAATEVEVAENSPSTTYVGAAIVAAVDPDGTTPTYTLEGEDEKFFALVTRMVDDDNDPATPAVEVNSRQIVVAQPRPNDEDPPDMWDKVDLDHEDDKKNTYTVELKASDGALDDTITVTITVTDRNEAPSVPMAASGAATTPDANNASEFPDTEDGMRSVAENTAAGENIGAAVMATDADVGDTLIYTLGGADMASFDIEDTTGQLKTKAALDYEAPADDDADNDYEVTVTASDGNTAADATIAVTITVTDVNETPEFPATGDGAREVAENTAAGETIGAPVEATDADAGDTLTYTLGGADMASFDIDGATGQLMTAAALDFEDAANTDHEYVVTVTATDAAGATDTITVTITVTDVNEDVIPGDDVISGDTNNDGMIDKPEVIAAFRAYIADPSDKTEIIQIFRQYVVDTASSQ